MERSVVYKRGPGKPGRGPEDQKMNAGKAQWSKNEACEAPQKQEMKTEQARQRPRRPKMKAGKAPNTGSEGREGPEDQK